MRSFCFEIIYGILLIVQKGHSTPDGQRVALNVRPLQPKRFFLAKPAVQTEGAEYAGAWFYDYTHQNADTRNAKATWLCDAAKHYPSTTYLKFILPTIRRGCTGDANRAATKMLQRLLGLTPDGIFGEGTENALLKAQEAHGLAVDGICGPASWRAISGANKYL